MPQYLPVLDNVQLWEEMLKMTARDLLQVEQDLQAIMRPTLMVKQTKVYFVD
jgi:hypothetical protein